MTIARRVRDCRYAKGWGPDELASRAEISRTALYQIECGKTETPRAGTLRRIAQALDVSIETLLGTEDPGVYATASLEASSAIAAADGWRPRREAADLMGAPFLGLDQPRADGAHDGGPPAHSRYASPLLMAREGELQHKFRELLYSPFGESLARIVEETHRLIPLHHERSSG